MGEQDQKDNQPVMGVATVDDLERINLSSVLSMTNTLHFHTLQDLFHGAAQAAKESGDTAAERG